MKLPVSDLTHWYGVHGRELPWRATATTPWQVLVSEVMLTQTPAARVVPLYQQWIVRWPDAPSLAATDLAPILRAWGRLGYPRRAGYLHQAAQRCVAEFAGQLPSEPAELRRLPGVGPYVAAAVTAFGFGRRAAVVDVNVHRVLTRAVHGVDARGPVRTTDRALLDKLLPADAAVAVDACAALMELGALRCTARWVRCDDCPLAPRCRWRAAGHPPAAPRLTRPRYTGSLRHARGDVLAALRGAADPIPVGPPPGRDATQWALAVAGLVGDGLAAYTATGLLELPTRVPCAEPSAG